MKKFKEIFGNYIDENRISSAILNADVCEVKVNSSLRTAEISLELNELVSRDDLHKAENALRCSSLALVKALIFPHFGKELFSSDYFMELVSELKIRIPRINGTFQSCETTLNGNNLNITLNNGGKAILDSVNFDIELAKLIYREFDIEVNISYDGVTAVDGESKEYIESQINTEKKLHRENLEKIADMFEDEEKTAKESAQERAEKTTKEIEIRKGKYLTPQIINSTIRPLYGRVVKGKIIPISNVSYDSGKVTVWGDVFSTEKKVTRSGDKNIITIDITDYTGSITVKVFGPIKNTSVVEQIKVGDAIVVNGDVEFDKFAGGLVINARSISTAQK
ncbi:MAG: PolC-type DNA polymerase III, partial [Ruminococcus sp.]|nr:PolC-type DNA polymerase III [Ruminococcus sp.]